jgi:hypothetical protein
VPNTIRFIETSIWNNTVVLYSTVKIVDSQGNTGMPVQLDPPMSMVSELYFFQCSKLVVPQTGKVDCRTKESSSLTPVMHKHQSAWRSDTLPPTNGDYPAFNPVMVESDCVGVLLASNFPILTTFTVVRHGGSDSGHCRGIGDTIRPE